MTDSRLDALVNPFNDLQSGSPDNVSKPEFEKDEAVEKVLKIYFSLPFAFKTQGLDDYLPENLMQKYISPLETNLLTPAQISLFVQRLKAQATRKHFYHEFTGLYLSRLVQDSYNNGNNNFVLDTGDFTITNLALLQGTKSKPLKLNLLGNADLGSGDKSEHCEYDIEGDAGNSFGKESRNCIYRIQGNIGSRGADRAIGCEYDIGGNVGKLFGSGSENSNYRIKGNIDSDGAQGGINCKYDIGGNAGELFGDGSENSMYRIKGNADASGAEFALNCVFDIGGRLVFKPDHGPFGSGAQRCKFITPDKETYAYLRKQFGFWNRLSKGNRVDFVK